ncbi:WSSV395 [White spot syndrome virus]|uniref:WSSV395 n=1 Tax=White spot syndrome virus TaxID=342409 RepID=A0A2I6SC79_9VIRU|nr:WSSV395 [White spot syndrome virus]
MKRYQQHSADQASNGGIDDIELMNSKDATSMRKAKLALAVTNKIAAAAGMGKIHQLNRQTLAIDWMKQ